MSQLYSAPRWSAQDHSMIDVTMHHSVHGDIPHTTCAGETLFARVAAGEFGAIAPYAPAPRSADNVRLTITALAERVFSDALRGKRASILSYGLRLWAQTPPLSDEEHLDLTRIVELDEWEELVIATREALIAAGDVDRARSADSWPAPPVWLTAEWLQEF